MFFKKRREKNKIISKSMYLCILTEDWQSSEWLISSLLIPFVPHLKTKHICISFFSFNLRKKAWKRFNSTDGRKHNIKFGAQPPQPTYWRSSTSLHLSKRSLLMPATIFVGENDRILYFLSLSLRDLHINIFRY